MDFAIDQSLKTYSGGLGFLAGSHMKSAHDLKQNLIGIGVLWKYGYYDQVRKENQTMGVLFQEKIYNFLVDTNIKFTIEVDEHPVWVKAYFLKPEIFGTVPMFFLTTDVEENDYLSKTITFKLYDSDPRAKIAQQMVLGIGGVKLLEQLNYQPEVYHMNEAHALSGAFYMYTQLKKVEEIKKRYVFTTHTPVEAGNEKNDITLLYDMGYFAGLSLEEAREVSMVDNSVFNHTLVALRLSHKANGVSRLHGEVSRQMWKDHEDIPEITHVTNAQHAGYWTDVFIKEAKDAADVELLKARKRRLKEKLFAVVADQTGKLFNPDVLTIVWARRFADYKRPDLITRDADRFRRLMERVQQPVQLIFAGKPYPMDYNSVGIFNKLVHISKDYSNMSVLVGYELALSRKLKEGADIWLNNPEVTREASGTSGMTAAMNGALNLSTNDGWVCEFIENDENSWVLPTVDLNLSLREQAQKDMENLYDYIENKVIPTYYDMPEKWWKMVSKSMNDIVPFFDSARMADEYYTKMY
jgi:starch phosphorylase